MFCSNSRYKSSYIRNCTTHSFDGINGALIIDIICHADETLTKALGEKSQIGAELTIADQCAQGGQNKGFLFCLYLQFQREF